MEMNSCLKNERNLKMETSEKQISSDVQEKLYTKEEVDSMKAALEQEIKQQEEKKSSMTELEKVQAELEEMKRKYEQKADECLIAKQMQETQELLASLGIASNMLEVVYTPKDMEATKSKIQILKNYTEEIKKQMQETTAGGNLNLPLTSSAGNYKQDPFLEGFMSA